MKRALPFLFVAAITIPFHLLTAKQAQDSIAFWTGQKAGKLILQQWIHLTKRNKQGMLKLEEEVAQLSKPYTGDGRYNESFILGAMDALQRKYVQAAIAREKLSKQQHVQVLACYYLCDIMFSRTLKECTFDINLEPSYQQKALEKAIADVYGDVTPALIAELKKALELDDDESEIDLKSNMA